MESFPLNNIFTNASWPLLWPSWLSQDLASKTRLLLEHSLATVSDVPYCCSADQKQKQQAFVCSRSEYPCSVFHVYKKLFFLVVFFFFFFEAQALIMAPFWRGTQFPDSPLCWGLLQAVLC